MKWLLLQAITFTPHNIIFGDIPAGGSCAAGTTPLSAGLSSHLAVEKLIPGGIPNQKVLLKSCALGGRKFNWGLYSLLLSFIWCCWPCSTLWGFFLWSLGCCLEKPQPFAGATDPVPTALRGSWWHSQEMVQWSGSFTGSFCSAFSSDHRSGACPVCSGDAMMHTVHRIFWENWKIPTEG